MARLSAAPSRLGAMPPRLARLTDAHGHSPVAEPWRAWYHTARWRAVRRAVLLRDLHTCRRCGVVGGKGMVADHVRPHRGDEALFWDEANLQALCGPCHSSAKQREEKRAEAGPQRGR